MLSEQEVIGNLRRHFVLAALVLAGGLMFHAGAIAQWNQGGFDQGKSYANSAEKTLARKNVAGLVQKWDVPVDVDVASEVTQDGGRLFTCGFSSGLYALQPGTGQTLWHQTLPGVGRCSAPALASGSVYVANSDDGSQNWLSAFDQATGQSLWNAALTPSGPNFGPEPLIAVDSQRVYVAMALSRVSAVNRSNGSVAWEVLTDDRWSNITDVSVGSGMVFVSGNYIAGSDWVSNLMALNASTGSVVWTRRIGGNDTQYKVYSVPMVVGSKVYVITAGGQLMCFDVATGAPISTLQLHPGAFMAATHDDRMWVVTDSNRTIQAVDLVNNIVLWTRSAGKHKTSVLSENMVWANHQLYAVVETKAGDHLLTVIRATDGKDAANIPLPHFRWPPWMSVVDGRVLIAGGGRIVALGL